MLPPKPGSELEKIDLRLIQPIFYSSTNKIDPVIEELHGDLECLNIIRGISGAGKTAAVLNVAQERFLIYLECSACIGTDFIDKNYQPLRYDIKNALKRPYTSNLSKVEMRRQDFDYAEFRCRLEWTARMVYLYLLLNNRRNITPKQYLHLQIDGGQKVIKSIVEYLKQTYNETNGNGLVQLQATINESISQILANRGYNDKKLIFFVDELNECIDTFYTKLYSSRALERAEHTGNLKEKDRSGLGTILSLHSLQELDDIHIVVSGTTISDYSKLVGSATAKPVGYKELSGINLPITTPQDVKSFLNEYIDMSTSTISDGIYNILQGRLRFLMAFLRNCSGYGDVQHSANTPLDTILKQSKIALINNIRGRIDNKLTSQPYIEMLDFLLALSICGLWGIRVVIREETINQHILSIINNNKKTRKNIKTKITERFDAFHFDPVIIKPLLNNSNNDNHDDNHDDDNHDDDNHDDNHDMVKVTNNSDIYFTIEEPVSLLALSSSLIKGQTLFNLVECIKSKLSKNVDPVNLQNIITKHCNYYEYSIKNNIKPFEYIIAKYLVERFSSDNNSVCTFLKQFNQEIDWSKGYKLNEKSTCGSACTLGYIKYIDIIAQTLSNEQIKNEKEVQVKIQKLLDTIKDKRNPLVVFINNMQNKKNISDASWNNFFSILYRIYDVSKNTREDAKEAAATLLFMLLRPSNAALNPFHHLGPDVVAYLSKKNDDGSIISTLPVYVGITVSNCQKKIDYQYDTLRPSTFFGTKNIKQNLQENKSKKSKKSKKSIWDSHMKITKAINQFWVNIQQESTYYLSLSVVLTLDNAMTLQNNVYDERIQTEIKDSKTHPETPIHHVLGMDNIHILSEDLSILFQCAQTRILSTLQEQNNLDRSEHECKQK